MHRLCMVHIVTSSLWSWLICTCYIFLRSYVNLWLLFKFLSLFTFWLMNTNVSLYFLLNHQNTPSIIHIFRAPLLCRSSSSGWKSSRNYRCQNWLIRCYCLLKTHIKWIDNNCHWRTFRAQNCECFSLNKSTFLKRRTNKVLQSKSSINTSI